jgi:uncharacterized protein (TIGR02444 family)
MVNQSQIALWYFANAFYRQVGVEPSLIALQDEAGLDIPLLLSLLHAGRAAALVDAPALAELIAIAHLWQERAVGPLRKVRRALARPIEGTPDAEREGLRAQVKQAELEAERLLLAALEKALPSAGTTPPEDAIRANIGFYIAALACQLSPEHEAALADLVLLAARFQTSSV